MKTVDGSKYSVHASSILESHDMSEPAAASASAASSKVQHCLSVAAFLSVVNFGWINAFLYTEIASDILECSSTHRFIHSSQKSSRFYFCDSSVSVAVFCMYFQYFVTFVTVSREIYPSHLFPLQYICMMVSNGELFSFCSQQV